MATRILSRHFAHTRDRLLEYAEHIGMAEHGDVKGLAREGIVQEFLSKNLPSNLEFKTGEIIDENDKRSGQIDLVLQSVDTPRIHLFDNIQLTMADAVLGIIEVKSSLTTASWVKQSHLKNALNIFQRVKSLLRNTNITGKKINGNIVTLEKIPCFLFAYHGPKKEILVDKLVDYGSHIAEDIDSYAPDVVTVLDQGYYVFRDNGWLFPAKKGRIFRVFDKKPSESLVGMFVYICRILEVGLLRSEHTRFAQYFKEIR